MLLIAAGLNAAQQKVRPDKALAPAHWTGEQCGLTLLLVALLGFTKHWQGIHTSQHTQRRAGKLFGNAGMGLLLKLERHLLTTAGELHWLCCLLVLLHLLLLPLTCR